MSAITDVVSGLMNGIGDAFSKVTNAIGLLPADKQAEITTALANLQAQSQQAQNDINKIEAASSNLFIAGWRPFIGWVCGIAIAYNFLLMPFGNLILLILGKIGLHVDFAMPAVDYGELWTLVTAMLGLGTMRTVEKMNNTQGNH